VAFALRDRGDRFFRIGVPRVATESMAAPRILEWNPEEWSVNEMDGKNLALIGLTSAGWAGNSHGYLVGRFEIPIRTSRQRFAETRNVVSIAEVVQLVGALGRKY
jgi:hypothetical protein